MSLTPCSVRLRYSAKGAVVKKIPLLNKNFVHFINNIFWNMGFKTETQAEKDIPNIHNYANQINYIIYTHYTDYAE